MPEWACVSELGVHLVNPFGVGGQKGSQLAAVAISTLAVILQRVQVREINELVSKIAFKETGCLRLDRIWEIAIGPDFKISPPNKQV
jgi:hypothetical protein